MKRKKKSGAAILWIMNVAGRVKYILAVMVVIEIALSVSAVYNAMLYKGIVNSAIAKDWSGFRFHAVAIVLLVSAQILASILFSYLSEVARTTLENRCKTRLFNTLFENDYAKVTATHSGEWMNRLTSDTAVVAGGFVDILPGALGLVTQIIAGVIALLSIIPGAVLIILPGGMLLIGLTLVFRKKMKELHKRIQEADGLLRVLMQERLESMLVIRAFSQEKRTLEMAGERMRNHKAARMHRKIFGSFAVLGYSVVIRGVYLGGAIYCGLGILNGVLTYGDFTAVLQLINQVSTPFASVSSYFPQYFAMVASAERLMEAEGYERSKNLNQDEESCRKNRQFESIGIRDVSFTYQPPVKSSGDDVPRMPLVLKDINLEVGRGEYVAFVGPSGCGKSTVLKLLMGLYPADKGELYLKVDGQKKDLAENCRGLYAYVPQGNQLVSGTIRDILSFGDEKAEKDDEGLWKALEIACADEFIRSLETGLDTQLGERGAGLSEGQMQRIAIARAVYSSHPVLLLDEATSSLDEKTEAKLLDNLRAMTDKTVIIVTHRPAVLSIVDSAVDFGKMGSGNGVEKEMAKTFEGRRFDV
uniref:ABC transporter ATP-binding protein n=1 Tax=Eubacterium cellulosolvens TaxID=29322 RepID=UPI000486D5FE|nr:ABC transporter ATP-binding protein [[Eubacterium] cellulosolvens]